MDSTEDTCPFLVQGTHENGKSLVIKIKELIKWSVSIGTIVKYARYND